MPINKYLSIFLLCFLVAIGFAIRTYNLGGNPAGFFCDEAATGYNAYSILTYGKDEYGKAFPLLFRSFGNYTLPIPTYADIPFIAIFGLNEFATRLPSAIVGTLTIFVVYFLLNSLYPKDKFIGIAGAFLVTFSPWNIQFSRFDSIIYLPLFIGLGVLLFVRGVNKESNFSVYLSLLIFSLGLYTYYASFLLIPLSLFACFIIYLKYVIKNKIIFLRAMGIFLLVSVPLLTKFIDGTALSRPNVVINTISKMPKIEIVKQIVKTYSSYFSVSYLFKYGDIDYPGQIVTRYSVRGMGELYWFEMPLIIAGIASMVVRRKKSDLLILSLLLIHPLAGAITNDTHPLATRSIVGSLSWPLVSAVGFSTLNNFFGKYKLLFCFMLLMVSSFFIMTYLNRYFYEYPMYSSDFWGFQYGPREIMKYFIKNESKYDQMYIEGAFNGTDILIKFYDPYNDCKNKCFDGTLDREYDPRKRQLFALAISKESEKMMNDAHFFKIIETIYYPNHKPAFYIGEITGNTIETELNE